MSDNRKTGSTMNSAQTLQRAFSLHRSGQFSEAAKLYRKVIKQNPREAGALHSLAIIETASGNDAEAATLMARSLSVQPNNTEFVQNYATVLCKLGRFDAAVEACERGLTLDARNAYLLYLAGAALLQLERWEEAVSSFDRLIALEPNNVAGLIERSTAHIGRQDYGAAGADIGRAISLAPGYAEAHLNQGVLFSQLGRYEEAAGAFDRAIRLKPDLTKAWLGRARAMSRLNRHSDALSAYESMIGRYPNDSTAWLGLANVHVALRQFDEALAGYDRAGSLSPASAEACMGRGIALFELGRFDDALAAYDRATTLNPALVEGWIGRGNALVALHRGAEALASFDHAASLRPKSAEAQVGRANALFELKQYMPALSVYDQVIGLKPDLLEAWLGRGNALLGLRRFEEASQAYQQILAVRPESPKAWAGQGSVYFSLNRFEEALSAYGKALSGDPQLRGIDGLRLFSKAQLCDWADFQSGVSALVERTRLGVETTSPFILNSMGASLEDQFACARSWANANFPAASSLISSGQRYNHEKIRLAYVSSDFRRHPVAHLIAGLFEHHDRSQFDVVAISIGQDDGSSIRERLKRGVDLFIEAVDLDADEIAGRIRAEEIDILVDLNGFTQNARTELFARRPAPIQVNYLGYPGTMGASYMDYILADETVIPARHRDFYAEKVAYLPGSFMPHDPVSRTVSDRTFSRTECGLSEDAFVFCAFNNAYKFNPQIFSTHMNILRAVPGSMLWLSGYGQTPVENLRREAAARGIDPARLVFADRMPELADHLARHRLADLFLDTLPYNAHTTAGDALWAGLPVLTQIGDAFAGRVAASLLMAAGLPDLVTETAAQFEQRAIELATNPEMLATLRQSVAEARFNQPVFDLGSFARNIERAYLAMQERVRAGLPPDHIRV